MEKIIHMGTQAYWSILTILAVTGFLSIDCGIAEDLNYTDAKTKIFYTSGARVKNTGTNKQTSEDYMFQTLPRQYQNVRFFPDGKIVSITDNFERIIGKGGFGVVYHGYAKDGTQVAVKMLSQSSSQGSKEFQTEVELLMRVHHRNLASFIGYCDEDGNKAIIYEYMAKGNLHDYLTGNANALSWGIRLRIALDAAQGLEYLHNGCKPPIIHRDVGSKYSLE
ncbi:hypothetical protein AAC387_Pa03g4471 [Persea americana]